MTARLNLGGQPVKYVDSGCQYAPRCLDCPLPRCRYDSGPEVIRGESSEVSIHPPTSKAYRACQDYNSGMSGQELAKKYGVRLSTVYSFYLNLGHKRGWVTREGRGRPRIVTISEARDGRVREVVR